ncbi:unnamed protein product [Lasius platythorax]|uniref:Uncharacterized protein n=1 Tax=Lasius platythorax TaxID=488582 RepID=A0AAV2P1M8_9HYME
MRKGLGQPCDVSCKPNICLSLSRVPPVRLSRILELDDVLQLYGRFGIRFYCYRIKRPPQERPLNIDSPARTIRKRAPTDTVAFYSGSVVGVDHVEEMPGHFERTLERVLLANFFN